MTVTADEAIVEDAQGRGAREEAKDFLLQVLSEGPVASKEVKRQAEEACVSLTSLRRAQQALGVEVRREGGIAAKGQWFWSLPKMFNGALRCPRHNVSTLATLGDFQGVAGANITKVLKLEREQLSGDDDLGQPSEWVSHLVDDAGDEPGPASDGDPFAPLKDETLIPDLPIFLDRRPRP